MLLSFLWSAQVSDVFVLLPVLSFFRFQGFAHAVEDAVRLLFVASLDVTLVLVVVKVTLLAGDEILFPRAPAPTPTAALAVFAVSFLALRFSSSIPSR